MLRIAVGSWGVWAFDPLFSWWLTRRAGDKMSLPVDRLGGR
jgi:hypothetical protein